MKIFKFELKLNKTGYTYHSNLSCNFIKIAIRTVLNFADCLL